VAQRAQPFFVTNVGGFRRYPILEVSNRSFPTLADEVFLLESNYVTLPPTDDILVVVERFPRDQALMWSAAYRAVPSVSAGRRGDYVGVGVLTSDVSVNSESLYNFISTASRFGLQAATGRPYRGRDAHY